MSYDLWKTADPCETWAGPSGEEEEEPPCVCGHTGWLEGPDGEIIPCTECSAELEEWDVDEIMSIPDQPSVAAGHSG